MPWAAPKACRIMGCPNFAGKDRYNKTLCEQHAKEKRRLEGRQRPTAAQRGYGAAWRKRSQEFLRKYPYCVDCDAPAKHADHRILKRLGGTDDDDNLIPRCKPCHSSRTSAEHGGFGNRRR